MSGPVQSTMVDELRHAAETGNIDTLYSILHRDPNILKTMDEMAHLAETPLHVAASSNANEETIGRVEFAIEVAILMPSFMRKLNLDGQTPLHLALLNRNFKTARALICIDANLIRFRGKGSKTPLHIAAEEGLPKILYDFLLACPPSVEDLTVRKETVAHLAAREGNLVTYKVLRLFLIIADKDVKDFMNRKNFEGDTALHIAASENKIKMARKLVKYVDRAAKNFNGKTALDVRRESPHRHITILETILLAPRWKCCKRRSALKFNRSLDAMGGRLSDDKSRDLNAVLVVAVLIATTTYQGILTPSGFWHSRFNNGTLADPSSSSNGISMTMNATSNYNGQQIMTDGDLNNYLYNNSITFLMSIAVIISSIPLTTGLAFRTVSLAISLVQTYWTAFEYSITGTGILEGFVRFFVFALVVYGLIMIFRGPKFQKEKKKMLRLIDKSKEFEPHRRDDDVHQAPDPQSSNSPATRTSSPSLHPHDQSSHSGEIEITTV